MSNPSLFNVPPDVASRLSLMFTRMGVRGELMPAQIYGYTPTTDPNTGLQNGRQRELLTTLQVYHQQGGGSEEPSTEGNRVRSSELIYFLPDSTGSLTDDNYQQRMIVLPARGGDFRRITSMAQVGPYCWAYLETGGTADKAGNAR